jgi:hypothetical protein
MKSIGERAPLRGSGSTAEPLHVFTDRSGTGVQLHECADHLALHADGGREVRAGWYRHIRRVGPSRENAGEALAIIDRAGHALVGPMAHSHVMQAHWLISNLTEWAERSRDRPGAWCAYGDDGSLAELVDEGRGLRATGSRARS